MFELLVVVGIILFLSALSVPAVMESLDRARFNSGAGALTRAHALARKLALQAAPMNQAVKSYGVALVVPADGGTPYATVLWGTSATDELMVDDNGNGADLRPLGRYSLGTVALPWMARSGGTAAALSGNICWFYTPLTGQPVQNGAKPGNGDRYDTVVVGIGTAGRPMTPFWDDDFEGRVFYTRGNPTIDPSPVCSHLSLRNRTDTRRMGISIYDQGIIACTEF